MRFLGLLSFVLALVSAGAASAQMRLDLERCRAIEDDPARLRCYDAIRLPAAREKYERLDLTELEDFSLSYRGRLVQVAGWLAPSGDIFVLKTLPEAERGLPVEIETLSRRVRQDLLAACGQGCHATVQGKVAPVNFVTGIIADAISPD